MHRGSGPTERRDALRAAARAEFENLAKNVIERETRPEVLEVSGWTAMQVVRRNEQPVLVLDEDDNLFVIGLPQTLPQPVLDVEDLADRGIRMAQELERVWSKIRDEQTPSGRQRAGGLADRRRRVVKEM